MARFIYKSTKSFSGAQKLDKILAEIKLHLPLQVSGSKIRIQDYKKSDSTNLVRNYIKDCLGFIKFMPEYKQSEIVSHTDPQAIYLLAIKGGKLFNPREEYFDSNPAYAVAIDKDDLDINKCYADPEFDSMYPELIKNYQGIPFIYDSNKVTCYQFNDPMHFKYRVGDPQLKFESGVIELTGGALEQWELHSKYKSVPRFISIETDDFIPSSQAPSKYNVESEKFFKDLINLLESNDKRSTPRFLIDPKGNTMLEFYIGRNAEDYWRKSLSFIPEENKDLSSFDEKKFANVVFIW